MDSQKLINELLDDLNDYYQLQVDYPNDFHDKIAQLKADIAALGLRDPVKDAEIMARYHP
jgi:hypothetical protein